MMYVVCMYVCMCMYVVLVLLRTGTMLYSVLVRCTMLLPVELPSSTTAYSILQVGSATLYTVVLYQVHTRYEQ